MTILFCLFFFFYCYRDHQDLHSFPTRRSSDLRIVIQEKVLFPVDGPWQIQQQHAHLEREDNQKCVINPVHRDRKSTRLNSSHQIISYAVFCLKKKKKQKKNTLNIIKKKHRISQ